MWKCNQPNLSSYFTLDNKLFFMDGAGGEAAAISLDNKLFFMDGAGGEDTSEAAAKRLQ